MIGVHPSFCRTVNPVLVQATRKTPMEMCNQASSLSILTIHPLFRLKIFVQFLSQNVQKLPMKFVKDTAISAYY